MSALLCVHPSEVLKTFAALDASCKLALLRVACEAACRASVVEGAMRAKEERREELGRRWEAEEKEERKRKREEREARRAEVRQTLEREGEVNELLVAERMRRLDQEEAVGKTTHVFTRDELAAAEGDRAMELDVAAAGVDESGNQLGAAQVAAAEARRDEMRKRLDRLGASRDAAEERLLQAVDDGKLGDGAAGAANLEAALEAARALALEGSHTADGVGPADGGAVDDGGGARRVRRARRVQDARRRRRARPRAAARARARRRRPRRAARRRPLGPPLLGL